MRRRSVLILLAVVVLAFLATFVYAHRHWRNATGDMQRRLYLTAATQQPARYRVTELAGLPAPVARYFHTVLSDGQPIIKRARITWKGEFNMGKPGADKWAAFTAEQDFVPAAPGFVWDARIAMAPGIRVFVRDAFVGGAGSTRGKVMGLLTVVDSHDTTEIAVAALQRYLGEAVWFPTALLPSQGVKWEPVDDSRARASVSGGGVTATLEFRFGADGLVASAFAPERMFDDGKSAPTRHPWRARNLRYGEFNGFRVPVDSAVEWLFATGPYAYWRGQPAKIEYEFATSHVALP